MNRYNPADVFMERITVLEMAIMEAGLTPQRLNELMEQVRIKRDQRREHGCYQGAECVRPIEDRLPRCHMLENVDLQTQLLIAVVWYHGPERSNLTDAIRAAKRIAAGKVDDMGEFEQFLVYDALGCCPTRTALMEDVYQMLKKRRPNGPADSNGATA
jgi:hypothetical protein